MNLIDLRMEEKMYKEYSNLKGIISTDKIVLICGDFNLRYQNEQSHFIIQELLNMNFIQQIDHPTHINGGIIDHLYLYCPADYEAE